MSQLKIWLFREVKYICTNYKRTHKIDFTDHQSCTTLDFNAVIFTKKWEADYVHSASCSENK